MEFSSEVVKNGVVERRFDLKVTSGADGAVDVVPGCLWLPEGATGPRPKILIGHGGTQHKKAPHIRAFARRFAADHGWATVAIDGPGHGDRVPPEERAGTLEQLRARLGVGSDDPVAAMRRVSGQHVAEWKAVLDGVEDLPEVGPGPTGYWGVSMGTMFGTHMVAAEPRITAAVLGLAASRSADDPLALAAAKIEIPVLFVLQRGDELFSLEHGIALFDAIASTDKVLHVNPGPHAAIPATEVDAMHAFFARTIV